MPTDESMDGHKFEQTIEPLDRLMDIPTCESTKRQWD